MKATIIRTDGKHEEVDLSFDEIKKACNYEWAEAVNLRNGKTMLCDEEALIKRTRPPFNREATKLYWSICVPGTSHPIHGDVAIVATKDLN